MIEKTSRSQSYLLQCIFQLFVGWFRTNSQPGECIVFVVAENVAKRFCSEPADGRRIVIWHQHDVCPAVMVSNRLERVSNAIKRPANTHHRIVGYWIVQKGVNASLWKYRPVPVGHDLSDCYTRCMQQNTNKDLRQLCQAMLKKWDRVLIK